MYQLLLHRWYKIQACKYLIIPANPESVIQYQISGTWKIPDSQYPIYLKIVRYEPNTDTNTDIITALVIGQLHPTVMWHTHLGGGHRHAKRSHCDCDHLLHVLPKRRQLPVYLVTWFHMSYKYIYGLFIWYVFV